MKHYTGTKTIMAKPMAKSEAEKELRRKIDTGGKYGEEGYLVEYSDGYRSWSPKEVFEKVYKPSETLLERMRLEYEGTKERLLKLQSFILTEEYRVLPENKGKALAAQFDAMASYLDVLAGRIDCEKKEQYQQKLAKAKAAAEMMRGSLVGKTIVAAGSCDACPDEPTDCKKLILADGTHICIK